ncbi:hypothetical protein JKG68_19495 [Microvirga aerilata]|uniref:Uncharacterized protein n=1 Tax=Microvirga aerilata TaxID=670292 RepID=A0A936ZAM4_9HYPH|nr:hypothetical protein [Microvirga aerilata]MBL0406151.1 hypothetical protein [Microvirga aerilata]
MNRTATSKSRKAEPAVLIFGLNGDQPCGARLTQRDADRLVPTSLAKNQRVVLLTEDVQKAYAVELSRGHIPKQGNVDLPTIDRGLYNELERAFSAQSLSGGHRDDEKTTLPGTGGEPLDPTILDSEPATPQHEMVADTQPDDQPVPVRTAQDSARNVPAPIERPVDWDEIRIGSLVLAYDPVNEGWYEAIVLMPHGDQWLLKWRDYPSEGTVARGRSQIALMYPNAA